MAKGGTWSGSYTVPGEATGYYSVLVNAHTHGPDGGPWLFDDVPREAWMFVSETDGQLTRHFEELLFPEGVRPEPGPATADGAGSPPRVQARHPDYVGWHPDSVYLQVLYYNDWRRGFLPAVGMELYGDEKGRGGPPRKLEVRVVPEDGIVSFRCPPWSGAGAARYLEGKGRVPETDYVRGRDEDVLDYWRASNLDCGRLKTVHVDHNWYLPWRHLDVGGERISKHFGHYRANPVNWNVDFSEDARAKYNWFTDKITLSPSYS